MGIKYDVCKRCVVLGSLIAAIILTPGCKNNKAISGQSLQAEKPAAQTPPVPSPIPGQQSSPTTPTTQPAESAADHFTTGKKMIEDNCLDCMGSSRSGLEQGLHKVQEAIDLGYQPAKDAYKLLADGYGDLTSFTKDKKEQEELWAKRNEVYGRLYELDPRDPEILEDYAQNVAKTDDEKVKALQDAVKINPKRASAQFLLSLLFIQKRDFVAGISAFKQAIINESNGESLANYVTTVPQALDSAGCRIDPEETQRWRNEAYEAQRKSDTGEGDAKAIPEFKERFLKFVDGISCAK